METLAVIPSGHVFTITTNDPVNKPLPSFQLLEMQWHLRRISAMQGAGENDESGIDSDGDDIAVGSRPRSRSRIKEDSSGGISSRSPPENTPFRS